MKSRLNRSHAPMARWMLGLIALASLAQAAAPPRSFDTNGDGKIELTIVDGNGDGYLEWPAGTKTLPGRLVFTATDRVAFSGTTTINTAQGMLYEAGSELVTRGGATLTKLVITANRGDVGGAGLLDLTATGDVVITAYSQVFLFGRTHVTTPGTIALTSKTFAVTVSQLDPDQYAPGAFALLAGKALNLTAKGNQASFLVDSVRVGGRAVNLVAQSSASASRFFLLRRDALVTSDPARTGLGGSAGNVTLSQQNDAIRLEGGAIVDSGKDVVLKAQSGASVRLCDAAIDAKNGLGKIDTRNVSGVATQDDASVVNGAVIGMPFVLAPCS